VIPLVALFDYKTLASRPPLFRSLTGVEVSEFTSIYARVLAEYKEGEAKRLARGDRKRKVGAGRPFTLPLQERLLTFLMYYRVYATSALLGFLFGIDQSNVIKDIHKLEPLLKDVLPTPQKVYGRVKQLQTFEEMRAMFPELKAFTDATEQQIPRPQDKLKRKTHYSGKKKRHTVKTQLTVNSKGLIVHKTRHAKGSTHDYALFKRSHPILPKKVKEEFDLGYVGVKDDFPDLNCVVPFKKKNPGRGKVGVKAPELSPEQKAFNKELARERVVSEHTNCRLKKFLIWGGVFRNRPRCYDIVTDIVSGLVNFRILGALTV
jgi:hypothetical protein